MNRFSILFGWLHQCWYEFELNGTNPNKTGNTVLFLYGRTGDGVHDVRTSILNRVLMNWIVHEFFCRHSFSAFRLCSFFELLWHFWVHWDFVEWKYEIFREINSANLLLIKMLHWIIRATEQIETFNWFITICNGV